MRCSRIRLLAGAAAIATILAMTGCVVAPARIAPSPYAVWVPGHWQAGVYGSFWVRGHWRS